MVQFWQLREWLEFSFGGTNYMKIYTRYNHVTESVVNAINLTSGAEVYLLPTIQVTPISNLHEDRLTPIICEPILLKR